MNKDVKKLFAKNVKKMRKQRKISQEALSLDLNLDISYIGKVENAKLNLTIEKIATIADFFNCQVKDLFS